MMPPVVLLLPLVVLPLVLPLLLLGSGGGGAGLCVEPLLLADPLVLEADPVLPLVQLEHVTTPPALHSHE
jgi:hypothetical protein